MDADGDGYGDAVDCSDGDPTSYPDAVELEDGLDNDCDGIVDEGTDLYDDDRDGTYNADDDGDEVRERRTTRADANVNPAAAEAAGTAWTTTATASRADASLFRSKTVVDSTGRSTGMHGRLLLALAGALALAGHANAAYAVPRPPHLQLRHGGACGLQRHLTGTARATTPTNATTARAELQAAEDVYEFTCPQTGTVTIDLTGLDCDLDFVRD